MKRISLAFILVSCALVSHAQKIDFDKKLKELAIELYPPTKPMGNYVKVVRTAGAAMLETPILFLLGFLLLCAALWWFFRE